MTPANRGLKYEDLQIPVADSQHIHGWWIPSVPPSEKALLFLHGNGYVIEDMVGEELTALHEIGANLLVVDYRGYGLSSSASPNEGTTVEDARAALSYLLHKRNFPLHDVVVLGQSIGSGPATELAYENKDLGGLILESPFTTIDAAASSSSLLRLFPVKLLLRTRFHNLAKVRSIPTPLLVVAGTADTLTPVWMARAILANALAPREIYLVKQLITTT